jgi:hypothetical protein
MGGILAEGAQKNGWVIFMFNCSIQDVDDINCTIATLPFEL